MIPAPVRPITLLSSLLCALVAACGGSSDAGESGVERSVEHPGGALDADGAPIPAEPRFVIQEGWTENPDRSSMRLAEFILPGEGEGQDAQLAVLGWPGGVGDVESNVTRWATQVGLQTAGSDLTADQRWIEEPRDFLVTMVHVDGALQSDPGMAKDVVSTGDDAILAAFIERPPSTTVWTAKVTGPSATVRAHRDRFIAFIRAL